MALPNFVDAGVAGILELDIGDGDSIEALAHTFGGLVDSLDVLVNNAGLNSGAFGVDRRAQGPLQTTKEVVLRQIEVNAVGPMLLTQALHRLLVKGHDPIVLNVSSQLGSMVVGPKVPFDVGYNASKSVLNMITVMSAAADRAVTYAAIHPGWVKSDMGGPGAAITIEESADGIVACLDRLTGEDSGRFLQLDGRDHPW